MTASTVWTLALTTPLWLITSLRPTESSPPISHSISMESAMSNFPSIRADSPTIVSRLVADALLPSPLVEPLRPSIVEPPCVGRITRVVAASMPRGAPDASFAPRPGHATILDSIGTSIGGRSRHRPAWHSRVTARHGRSDLPAPCAPLDRRDGSPALGTCPRWRRKREAHRRPAARCLEGQGAVVEPSDPFNGQETGRHVSRTARAECAPRRLHRTEASPPVSDDHH